MNKNNNKIASIPDIQKDEHFAPIIIKEFGLNGKYYISNKKRIYNTETNKYISINNNRVHLRENGKHITTTYTSLLEKNNQPTEPIEITKLKNRIKQLESYEEDLEKIQEKLKEKQKELDYAYDLADILYGIIEKNGLKNQIPAEYINNDEQ